MEEIKEIKKKGRPSKKDNVLTKNAFEKKEDDLPSKSNQSKADVPLVALDMPAADRQQRTEKKEEPKEAPPTAPNTPVAPVVPIDLPKPKKERSAAQLEATKRMLEANKLKKVAKKEIIIKQEIPDPVPIKEVPKPKEPEPKAKPKPEPKADDLRSKSNQSKAKPKKKEPVYESSEEESESSSEEYIQKYVNKAARKIQVVNSIEERLRQNAIPRNKYSNLSIFS